MKKFFRKLGIGIVATLLLCLAVVGIANLLCIGQTLLYLAYTCATAICVGLVYVFGDFIDYMFLRNR